MRKLTPVYVVERIEPCLDFWVNRLGFAKTVEVAHGDCLGFVILVRDKVEIMYQTLDSVRDDAPALLEGLSDGVSPNGTYIEVSDIGDIERRLAGWTIAIPKRTTFYGATEIGVREPGGNFILFAQVTPDGSASS